MSQCTTTQDVLVKLEQAVERGDVPYLQVFLSLFCARATSKLARPTASILETNPVDRRRIVHFADG